MIRHTNISDTDLRSKIRGGEIGFGGNQKLKIYGILLCVSGKRMLKENRVFFTSGIRAEQNGFRPCGHCMKAAYKIWKDGLI